MPSNNDSRFGTATTTPDADGRVARFGIYGIVALGRTLVVAYEGEGEEPPWVRGPLISLPAYVFASVTWTRYFGAEDATPERVARYLLTNFTRGNLPLTYHEAYDLVIGHPELEKALDLASYAYFPAFKIAEAAGPQFIDLDPDDEAASGEIQQ